MKNPVVIIGVFLFIYSGIIAQEDKKSLKYLLDEDKSRFERIMENETNDSVEKDDLNDLHTYYLIPEELPEWFFHPGEFASSENHFIGISDAGMDSLRAYRLAVLRAKALSAMAQDASIDHVSDHFQVVREASGEYSENSQYLDFSRVFTKAFTDSSGYHIDRRYYTKYGEGIVLVSRKAGTKRKMDTLNVEGEFMQLSREDQFGLDNTMFCKLRIRPFSETDSTQSLSSEYVYKSEDRRFNLYSLFEEDTIPFPAHAYRYIGAVNDSADSTCLISYSLSTGLWNSYINTLFGHISYYNRNLPAKVKSSYDHYTLKNQGIIRSVSRNRFSFTLHRILIDDNELFMKLDFY